MGASRAAAEPASTRAVAVDGPRGQRSSKGSRTRARIVEAAKAVFQERGIGDARVADIADRAGLSPAAFYHYFDSKDEVLLEVAQSLEDRLGAHSVMDSGLLDRTTRMGVRARLRSSTRRYLAVYRDESGIMGVVEQASRDRAQVREARFECQRLYAMRAEDAIRRLQAAGLADRTVDPAIAAPALGAMVNRFAELWLVQGLLDCRFEDAVDQLTALCVNALGLRDPAPAA
jgi:AcrR family transcriptional regulator